MKNKIQASYFTYEKFQRNRNAVAKRKMELINNVNRISFSILFALIVNFNPEKNGETERGACLRWRDILCRAKYTYLSTLLS